MSGREKFEMEGGVRASIRRAVAQAKRERFRLFVAAVFVADFSFLGVISRVFLNKFFVLGCDGGWGPCLQGAPSEARSGAALPETWPGS